MGTKTRAQLLTQAGLAANQDADVGTFVRDWLDGWLARTAKSWSWPKLKFPVTDVLVGAGVYGVVVGNGEGGFAYKIHELVGDTIIWRNAGYTSRGVLYATPLANPDPSKDARTTQAARRLGTPLTFKLRKIVDSPSDDDAITLELDPVPNVAVYLSMDVHIIPDDIGSTSATDSAKPWYPNDKTLVQACKCAFMELDDGAEGKENYENAMEHLEKMVIADRDFDGQITGDNQMMMLDPSVFR